MISLYRWQEECLNTWKNVGYKGIAEVTTGAGKTLMAVQGSLRLDEEKKGNLSIYVVVPKVALKKQWRDVLSRNGAKDIEIWSNVKSKKGKYTIMTINTARDMLPLLVEKDFKANKAVLLILDEVHHYGSPANSHVFDFLHSNHFKDSLYYSLGLSATTKVRTLHSVLIPKVGDVFFRYTLSDALSDGIVNDFVVFNVAVHFNDEERGLYDVISKDILFSFGRIFEAYPILKKINASIFDITDFLYKQGEKEMAWNLEVLIRERRDIIIRADTRIKAALGIIKYTEGKTIVFTERIDQVDVLFAKLKKDGIKAVMYHGDMETKIKEENLKAFKEGTSRILLCCKALDEGLDVPDADIAIVLSTTATELQRIQRIGRVIRKSNDKLPSSLYYIHVPESVEDNEYLNFLLREERIIVDIDYKNGEFIDSMYIEDMVAFLELSDFSSLSKVEIERLKYLLKGGCLRIERFLDAKALKYLSSKKSNSEFIKLFLLMKKTLQKSKEETSPKKISNILIDG